MQTAIDTAITYRILRLLTTPWAKQRAFKLGIIDDQGNPLKKYSDLKSQEQRNAYTVLVRLVFRLKRLIEKIPLGNKQFLSYAAALALLKECADLDKEPLDLESMFYEVCQMDGLEVSLVEGYISGKIPVTFKQFCEDGGAMAGGVATNSTGPAVSGTGDDSSTVVVKKKKPKILTRGEPNE